MLHHPHRNLLLVINNDGQQAVDIDTQVKWLHNVLFTVENIYHYSLVNEIIDINKYKVIRQQHLVQQILRQPYVKPFQFICCKN